MDETDNDASASIGASRSHALQNPPGEHQPGPFVPMTLTDALVEPERTYILASLEHHAWNRQRTAEQLGINRTTLYKKMRQLGIDPGQFA